MKAIVTGGCGFIGSHIAERLIYSGYDVFIIDDLSLGTLDNIYGLNVKTFTEPYFNALSKIYSADIIFHLGIPSSSPMYRKFPLLLSKSISDAIVIFEYAKRFNSKVIYASTSSLYNGNKTPYNENMPIFVTDYYTECRYSIERLSEIYYKLYGVKSVGLRLFSVYGPREDHKGEYANVITQFLCQMIKDNRPTIYGDGNQTRDFIYVDDVVNAFILAAEGDFKCEIFNVGTGKSYSFNQIIKYLNEILDKSITPKYEPIPINNYVYHTLADTKKAENVLKFKSKIDIISGIKKLNDYYSKGVNS